MIYETVFDGYIEKIVSNFVVCLVDISPNKYIYKFFNLNFFIDNKVIPVIGIGFEVYYHNDKLKIKSLASDRLRLRSRTNEKKL